MKGKLAIKILKDIKNHYQLQGGTFQASLNIGIQAIEKILMLERMTKMYKQKDNAPTRTISMEELRQLIEIKEIQFEE